MAPADSEELARGPVIEPAAQDIQAVEPGAQESRGLPTQQRTPAAEPKQQGRSTSRSRAPVPLLELDDAQWAATEPTTQQIGGAAAGVWKDARGRFNYSPVKNERLSREHDIQRAEMTAR